MDSSSFTGTVPKLAWCVQYLAESGYMIQLAVHTLSLLAIAEMASAEINGEVYTTDINTALILIKLFSKPAAASLWKRYRYRPL
jgi:hypothetical protein